MGSRQDSKGPEGWTTGPGGLKGGSRTQRMEAGLCLPGVLSARLWNWGSLKRYGTRQAGQGPIWRGPGIKAGGLEELSPQMLLFSIKALGGAVESQGP